MLFGLVVGMPTERSLGPPSVSATLALFSTRKSGPCQISSDYKDESGVDLEYFSTPK